MATPSGARPSGSTRSPAMSGLPGPSPAGTLASYIQATRNAYHAAAQLEPLFAPHAEFVFKELGSLGEGGMGVVLRVEDRRLGREAALKLLNPDTASAESAGRFLREARLMARLDHPAIPAVFEAGMASDGRLYLLMRVIEGQTLKERLKEFEEAGRPGREQRELIEVLLKVCEAVSYAHSQGIIHRDIKPSNIMIGGFGEVFLMDWGIARDLEEQESEGPRRPLSQIFEEREKEGLTRSDSLLGTPGYMSPEQARSESTDERSDVFSLGVILTEVLTGSLPIGGATPAARVAAVADGRISSPRQLSRRVPTDLDSLARSCLAFDPADRLSSSAELVGELRSWLESAPLRCHRYGLIERLSRFVRQSPGIVMAGLALSLTFGAGAMALAEQRRLQAENERIAAARERDQRILVEQQAQAAASEAERKAAELARQRAEDKAQKAGEVLSRLNEAREAMRRGADPVSIKALITQALEGSQREASVLSAAAEVLDASGDLSAAASLLREIAERFPPAYEALAELHEISMRERNEEGLSSSDAMKELIQRARDRNEVNEYTLFFDAATAIEIGQKTRALDLLNQAVERNPNYVSARSNRAMLQNELGETRAALEDLDIACRLAPQSVLPFLNRAIVRSKAGERESALEDLNSVIRRAPRFAPAYNTRGALLSELERLRDAVTDFSEALKIAPRYLQARRNRGRVYLRLNEDELALADYEAILERNPRDLEAQVDRAYVWLRRGKDKETLELAERLCREHPRSNAAWGLHGYVLSRLERYSEAVTALERALSLKTDNVHVHVSLSSSLRHLGRPKESMSHIEQALKMSPRLSSALLEKANVLAALGRHKEAEEAFTVAIDSGSRSVHSFIHRATAREANGDYVRALEDCRQALALDSDDASIYCQIGLLEARRGRFNEARQAFKVANTKKPGDGRQLYNLTCVLGLEAANARDENRRREARAEGLAVLEEALIAGYKKFALMERDSDIASLRDGPEFAALLTRFR
jgi:tetratricopeptide (TPR) repeat protein